MYASPLNCKFPEEGGPPGVAAGPREDRSDKHVDSVVRTPRCWSPNTICQKDLIYKMICSLSPALI